eukprot:m.29293 g.29293  ORF g.29293 m.29293 type:complete len:105 (+) comp31156_c1_seq1:339-653(+)
MRSWGLYSIAISFSVPIRSLIDPVWFFFLRNMASFSFPLAGLAFQICNSDGGESLRGGGRLSVGVKRHRAHFLTQTGLNNHVVFTLMKTPYSMCYATIHVHVVA